MKKTETETQSGRVSRTVAKNAAFVTAGRLMLKSLNFVFGVYVVRRLGGEQLGLYSIVIAWVGLFTIFAELGITQYAMREIARDRSRAHYYFWNVMALRLGLAVFGMVAISLGAVLAGYSQELVFGVFLYTCTFVVSAIESPLEMILTAYERLGYTTLLLILGQLSFIVLGSIVLYSQQHFIYLVAISIVAMLPQLMVALWLVVRHGLLRLQPDFQPRTWLRLIRSGLPFAVISLALTIAFSIDTVMLSKVVVEREVGWYNVGYGLVFSLTSLLSGFSIAMVPSLSKIYATDVAQVERWYYRTVKFILLLSVPMAVGGMMVAFPLFAFLYTPDFKPAALGLQILIWDVPLLMFTAFCGNMTTVIGAERAAARIYSINAIANVILNLYAIPKYGMVGAALVTVVTDLIGALQFHFLLQHKMKLPNMTRAVVRVALASTLVGVVVWLAGNQNLFLLIGLGVVTYGLLVFALRLIDAEEWALVRRLLPVRGKASREG